MRNYRVTIKDLEFSGSDLIALEQERTATARFLDLTISSQLIRPGSFDCGDLVSVWTPVMIGVDGRAYPWKRIFLGIINQTTFDYADLNIYRELCGVNNRWIVRIRAHEVPGSLVSALIGVVAPSPGVTIKVLTEKELKERRRNEDSEKGSNGDEDDGRKFSL